MHHSNGCRNLLRLKPGEITVVSRLCLVFTVFESEANIPSLISALETFCEEARSADLALSCVFVVDGSPDDSITSLTTNLENVDFAWRVVPLTRNFGAPSALRCGLEQEEADFYCGLACDQQEPFSFVLQAIVRMRQQGAAICFGQRISRKDPLLTRLQSNAFWFLYRRLIEPELPPGGVDLFVCTREVRDFVATSKERNQFLVGLLFWSGFKRTFVPYRRGERKIGRSSWSFRKRLGYLLDGVFAFSNLPIKALLLVGMIGLCIAVVFAMSVFFFRLVWGIQAPGYAATVVSILFYGGLNCFGLGILGEYLWRAYCNTQQRPLVVIDKSGERHCKAKNE